MVESDKKTIRQKILKFLKEQSPPIRSQKSEAVYQSIRRLTEFQSGGWFFSYVSLDYEVDTTSLIDQQLKLGKRVVVPCISDEGKNSGSFSISEIRDRLKELEIGPFGIWQPKAEFMRPVSPTVLAIAIIPGIAFDRQGHRLGHGKGYFDRFLQQLSSHCLKVGIGFDFQLILEIPFQSHDIPLDVIVTDKEIVRIRT